MSTRSNIGIIEKDGSVKMIYCHFDGYLEGVGITLLGHFEEQKVRDLLELGDLSSLDETPEKSCAYHRNRGEELQKAKVYPSIIEAQKDMEEYLYLWSVDESCWLFANDKISLLKHLDPFANYINYVDQEEEPEQLPQVRDAGLQLQFAKIHEDAKAPEKAHDSDAGYDVFWCQQKSQQTYEGHYWLQPGKSHRFETGLKFNIPEGWALVVFNRSGVASKRDVVVGACVIDEGYKGEVFIDLHNIGIDEQVFTVGDKIAQFLLIQVPKCTLTEVPLDGIISSKRGDKGFGSSDASV